MLILGKDIPVTQAPVHVAPGGSVRIAVSGTAANLASLLKNLMEEVAFGMIQIKADDPASVCAEIYMGKADESAFDEILSNLGIDFSSIERSPINEGESISGFNMPTRNQIIAALH
jgi:hypothetical protein